MTHHTGPWAHPPLKAPPRAFPWIPLCAFGFGLAGVGLALLLGDVPEPYEAPRGYDICQTKGC